MPSARSGCKWHLCHSRGGQQVDRDRPVDRRGSPGRSRLILHWIDKITKKNTFNQYQYSRKSIKFSMNWLFMYILFVSLVLADHRLARQMPRGFVQCFPTIAWQSWFTGARDNLLFIGASLTKAMVYCICKCNTQIWHFVLVTLLLTGQ